MKGSPDAPHASHHRHREQVDAQKVWVHTRSGLSFNPYQRILPDATIKNDTVFTEQMMDYCRAQLGPR
jgi:hypothetical protein